MYCPLKNCECHYSKCANYQTCILLTAETKAIENADKLNTLERQVKEIHDMVLKIFLTVKQVRNLFDGTFYRFR